MQADAVEALGLVAGFVGAFAFAPQALKILRGGDASSVSALTYTLVLAGRSSGEFTDFCAVLLPS